MQVHDSRTKKFYEHYFQPLSFHTSKHLNINEFKSEKIFPYSIYTSNLVLLFFNHTLIMVSFISIH